MAEEQLLPQEEQKQDQGNLTGQPQAGPAGPGEGLILGKFRSWEDLAEAYQNLERAFHAVRSGQQPAPEPEQPEPSEGLSSDEFYQLFADNPVEAVRRVAAPVIQQTVEDTVRAYLEAYQTWEALKARYPDAAELEDTMRAYVPAVERMLQDGMPLQEAVERIYRVARAEKGLEGERAQVRQRLLGTVVESGGPAGPPVASRQSPEQQIVQAILNAAGGRPVLRES